MAIKYKKADKSDIDVLTKTRIQVLRAANELSSDIDLSLCEQESYQYYSDSLDTREHIAYLVYDEDIFIGAGGISFFRVMPTYQNPTGKKAYIMNMYTHPDYRRRGIAYNMLDLLVNEAKVSGITDISLEATKMGMPLYLRYGFLQTMNEMKLPRN